MKNSIVRLLAVTLIVSMVGITGCGAKSESTSSSVSESVSESTDETVSESESEEEVADEQEPEVSEETEVNPDSKPETDSEKPTESKPEDNKPAESKPEESKPEASGTIAQSVISDFKANASGSTEEIANKLLNNPKLDFGPATMPVEPGLLNGFSGEINGFSEGTMFSPMIGTIPFVGYVFKLDGSVGANDFMNSLKNNADLGWNICTRADDMEVANSGDYVVFVMAPREF